MGRDSTDYRVLFEASPQAYLALTPELRIAAVSDAYLKVSLREREQLVGRLICETSDNPAADALGDLLASLKRVIDTLSPDLMPVQQSALRHPQPGEPEVRYWRSLNSPVLGPDGSLRYIIHCTEDITHLVLLEQQHRTMEKMAAELHRTTHELELSNADLTEFADVVSHDLKEPVRMISHFVRLLHQRYAQGWDPKGRELLTFVVQGAERMQALINALLTYSRVGSEHNEPSWCNAEDAVSEALQDLRLCIEEREAVVIHDVLPTLPIGKSRLRQVFQNLVGNALKFAGPKIPRIQISAAREGNSCIVSVRDNGIGIDPEHAERIFILFQRLHSPSEYPGNGVGLAVCKKIIERSGGQIWVRSNPEGGSIFEFALTIDG